MALKSEIAFPTPQARAGAIFAHCALAVVTGLAYSILCLAVARRGGVIPGLARGTRRGARVPISSPLALSGAQLTILECKPHPSPRLALYVVAWPALVVVCFLTTCA